MDAAVAVSAGSAVRVAVAPAVVDWVFERGGCVGVAMCMCEPAWRSHHLLRALSQDTALLGNLVRLADYLVVEGSLQLLQSTIEDMAATMGSTPLIVTQLSFAPEGRMVFSADEDEVREVSSHPTASSGCYTSQQGARSG